MRVAVALPGAPLALNAIAGNAEVF